MHFILSPIWPIMKYIPIYNSVTLKSQKEYYKSKIIKMLESDFGYNRPTNCLPFALMPQGKILKESSKVAFKE